MLRIVGVGRERVETRSCRAKVLNEWGRVVVGCGDGCPEDSKSDVKPKLRLKTKVRLWCVVATH